MQYKSIVGEIGFWSFSISTARPKIDWLAYRQWRYPGQDFDQSGIHITALKELGTKLAINQYLESRDIDLAIAKSYCHEVYCRVGDKSYFAAGFENRSGGYELRSAYFKGSTSPKDISHIENGHSLVCVLEGFMDFLSLLSLRKQEQIQTDFVVLNSVNLAECSVNILKSYSAVFLYVDHDAAGKKLLEKFENLGLNCVDASGIYRDYKDLNQMLVASGVNPGCKVSYPLL